MAMLGCSSCMILRSAMPVMCPPAASLAEHRGFCAVSTSSTSLSTSGRGFDVRRGTEWTARTSAARSRGDGGRRLTGIQARGGRKESSQEESKAVYDAFFLGKALAETINERVGSAIGELLSDVGRRQAEQRKKIREFQDEVQKRAAAAALKAAQKALATEKEKEKDKTPPAGAPPPSPSPRQPPPSTSGLSNPEDAPPRK